MLGLGMSRSRHRNQIMAREVSGRCIYVDFKMLRTNGMAVCMAMAQRHV